jgi:PAS domain S-box-containing protein
MCDIHESMTARDDDFARLQARNEELERAVEAYRRVFECSPTGMAIATPDGAFVDINPSGLRLFEMERAEVIGRTAAELRLDEEQTPAQAAELGAELSARGSVRDSRQVLRSKSGALRPVALHVDPFEVQGETRYLSTFLDPTERGRAEDLLRASEEKLREAQAIAQLGSWDWDLLTGAVTRSAELLHIYGVARESIESSHGLTWDHVHPDDRARARAIVDDAVEMRQGFSCEFRCVRTDGVRIVQSKSRMICNDAGEPIRMVGTVQDVTERRLVESRLMLADRMASVGTLAAGVAHEINNPLAYVISNLDLIAEEIRAINGDAGAGRFQELSDLIGEARQGSERIRRIVRGLKTFSRADAERRLPLDVHQVLDVASNIASNEIRHRARLVKEYGDVPLVSADEARLAQMMINLLVNAAQAIPEGHADRNEIRVTTRTDVAGRAIIEVRDTGSGMTRDVQARIFDPFFTTKPVGIGLGLGLSICHGIVSALGGDITIESEVGKGTVVRVALPAAPVDAAIPESAPVTPIRATKVARILVLDDDALVGKTLRRALKDHDVTVLSDAREARDRLAAGERFDLILCDLMMPEMTGMELHAVLSATIPEQAACMVFVTGGAFTPSAMEFLEGVANERIDKPFDLKTIRDLVQRLLG